MPKIGPGNGSHFHAITIDTLIKGILQGTPLSFSIVQNKTFFIVRPHCKSAASVYILINVKLWRSNPDEFFLWNRLESYVGPRVDIRVDRPCIADDKEISRKAVEVL